MTLVTFEQMLRLHDWDWLHDEDPSIYMNGRHQEGRINEALGILEAQGHGEEARQLFKTYSGGMRDLP